MADPSPSIITKNKMLLLIKQSVQIRLIFLIVLLGKSILFKKADISLIKCLKDYVRFSIS